LLYHAFLYMFFYIFKAEMNVFFLFTKHTDSCLEDNINEVE
jgi:hypothetical protein